MSELKRMSKANARQSTRRKNRYAVYQTRSTCAVCNKVFRSPKKLKAHKESGHKSMVGVNERRVRKALS